MQKNVPLPSSDFEALDNTKPLPPKYYVDQRTGRAYLQAHIRGITPESHDDFTKSTITFEDMIVGHNIHLDLRLDLGLKRLVQFTIVDSDIASLIRMVKGDVDPATQKPQRSLVILKPGSSEPIHFLLKSKNAITRKGAELLKKYIDFSRSFFIQPGRVGATSQTYGFLALLWIGEVVEGVQREDLHEYQLKPRTGLVGGRYLVQCTGGHEPAWLISRTEPAFLNPWCHCDHGSHFLKPPKNVSRFGRTAYPEFEARKGDCRKSNLKVLSKSANDFIIAGYASVPVVDLDNDLFPMSLLKTMFTQFMAAGPEFRNLCLEHQSLQIGTILEEYGKFKSGVDDTGLFVVAKLRNGIPYIDNILKPAIAKREYSNFSIYVVSPKSESRCNGSTCINEIKAGHLVEISIVKHPANPGAMFEQIRGDEYD